MRLELDTMIRRTIFFTVIFLLAGPVFSQSYERVLIPVHAQSPTEGVGGSKWITDLAVFVDGESPVLIQGYDDGCRLATCPIAPTPPGVTFYPSLFAPQHLEGWFIKVEEQRVSDVKIELRARDISKNAIEWGTEIPTVPESMAPTGSFQILDVPLDDDYRVTLRLYGWNLATAVPVQVRIYKTDPGVDVPLPWNGDSLISEFTAELERSFPYPNELPGHAMVPDLASRIGLSGNETRARIEVWAGDGQRIWGFVTVTNNETQHVTIVSPD